MARKPPAPISLKKKRTKPTTVASAPEPKAVPVAAEPKTVTKIVKDKALEARVALLEGAANKEIIVKLPERPRITNVKIKYDNFGHPEELIPTYSG